MTTRTSWRNVGQKIRYLRKEHQLTIKQLANGCDLSPNAISLIERGEVAPTVATLCKVANALGAPIGSFFQEICPDDVMLTQTQHPSTESLTGINQPLTQTLQTLTCAISPQDNSIVTDMTDHTSQAESSLGTLEVVVCLSGQIECEANGQRYHLNPGDNLSFNGKVPHQWRNHSTGPAVALIFLPAGTDPSLAREGE